MRPVSNVVSITKRLCSRPLCAVEAEVVLLFDYRAGHVVLDWTHDVHDPNHLELCAGHAGRFRPPNGWTLDDHRGDEPPSSITANTNADVDSLVV
ncbi:MAG: DUF3499 family protein [Actinomycetia bacterium]|nr:DUF3499 family protein [Actinomycetes bacterium]